ncbi:hypothetical protein GN244_ATG18854 [Phytophthora infestans]|uniref:Uncharacterized protein n=1 Tax=Phytophthora infestans TaxID=4787 RepID=A0A833SQG8_PHYIN|nr:hypothetical protein GN244_ATG18854 [Phytophthora infestans]KAF4138103.1 hypothetical protein GN958_ATG12712 [Phytophthora infestans]KAI9980852.1 hypothetical protein PInf_010185 [Phytophthora infestans]
MQNIRLSSEVLMTPEEAVIKAAATNQLLWIDSLLDTFDGDLADAISSAPVNGHVDMMHRLVREIGKLAANDGDDSDGFSDDSDESSDSYESSYDSDDSSETDNGSDSSSEDSDDDSVFDIFSDDLLDMMQQLLQPIGEDSDSDDGDFSSESDDFSDDSDEDSEDDDVEERINDKTRRALQNAVQTAAQYGQLTVVSFFLPQIIGASDDEEARRDMHDTTWKVLNEAAAYGHFDVIQFAVNYATECGYIELYAASGEADASTRAIAGRNDAVATYILGMRSIQWDLDRASDKAIQGQRSGLGN